LEQRGLVEQARGGDHDAFTTLVIAAAPRLDAAARLILRDRELARDAVQDALIRAWRDLPGLREPDRFAAWLHRLTVNACLDIVRRRRRRPIEVVLGAVAVATSPDASRELAERDELEQALARLEPELRALVVLHHYLGMPLPEASASLNIPLGTAKSRLHRALTGLRRALEPEGTAAPELQGGRIR
jgi:RNA polymerase sigma-70 factor (ECF subfamily)